MANKLGDVVSKSRLDANHSGFVCFDLLKFPSDTFDLTGEQDLCFCTS